MGLYDLHQFLFDVYSHANRRETFLSDPAAVYTRYTLTDLELTALGAKDIYRLSKPGVPTSLFGPFVRLLGFQLTGDLMRAGACGQTASITLRRRGKKKG
ncbi:hypothetical protein NKDENANG_02769 [Candidatus Entotheonellaceae bacterium PAL068K]